MTKWEAGYLCRPYPGRDSSGPFGDRNGEALVKNARIPPVFGKSYRPPKDDMLWCVRDGFEKEFKRFSEWREGKITFSEWKRDRVYFPYYLADPEHFERDTALLYGYKDELTPADIAWIKNTWELIKKYHPVVKKEMDKIRYGAR